MAQDQAAGRACAGGPSQTPGAVLAWLYTHTASLTAHKLCLCMGSIRESGRDRDVVLLCSASAGESKLKL